MQLRAARQTQQQLPEEPEGEEGEPGKGCRHCHLVWTANNPFCQDDFEHFAWTIVFLAMGGIALGKGVNSSGLLDVLDDDWLRLSRVKEVAYARWSAAHRSFFHLHYT